MRRGGPIVPTALALLLVGVVAAVYATVGSGFAIDKSHTFLGFLSFHGTEAKGGVHEQISAKAIRRGTPDAPAKLVMQIQAGAENVDVLHHFDAEYHFDSFATRSPVKDQRQRLVVALATVQSHLNGARPLADHNPEFFKPSYGSYRAIAGSLAAALAKLGTRKDCGGCSRTRVAARAALVTATLPHFGFNKYPDPHRPTNKDSMFSFNAATAKCGVCGALWPANKVSREFQAVVAKGSRVALAQSKGLKPDDPLRRKIVGIADALRAYRAFQAIGHAFHATQDFFAHSNFVELMAGVEVEQPIKKGTRIPVPQRRADFSTKGLRALMGAERYAKLESGSAAAIWLGEGDYCVGSPYNPATRKVLFTVPAAVAKLLGVPRQVTTPGGKNPRPPQGLNYCHYPSKTVDGVRTPGLNKDEPGTNEPSLVNHEFARQAAEDMTAVLWKSFLTTVRRPEAPNAQTPTPKPKPQPKPPGSSFEWVLSKTETNPGKSELPPNATGGARDGHIDWGTTVIPQAEFDVDFKAPPKRVKPGAEITFTVTATGELTGEKTQQGFRWADVILLFNDRWVDNITGARVQCVDPIGAEPISCKESDSAKGSVARATPTFGDTFSIGIGVLNCGPCYVRYTYVAK